MTERQILCDIYKGDKTPEMYLYVPRQSGFTQVPQTLLDSFGATALVTSLTLSASRKLARADIFTVLADLTDKGYYLQMPPAKFSLSQQVGDSEN